MDLFFADWRSWKPENHLHLDQKMKLQKVGFFSWNCKGFFLKIFLQLD